MVDFHLVLDMVPTLAKLFYLQDTLPKGAVNLSYVQSSILIGIGLQFKKVEDLEKDLGLNTNQILPQFNKVMRKFTKVIKSVFERDIEQAIEEESKTAQQIASSKIKAVSHIEQSLEDELDNKEGSKLLKQMKDDKTSFLKAHAVKGITDKDIDSRLKTMQSIPSVVSLPKREAEEESEELETKVTGKKSHKKKRHH